VRSHTLQQSEHGLWVHTVEAAGRTEGRVGVARRDRRAMRVEPGPGRCRRSSMHKADQGGTCAHAG